MSIATKLRALDDPIRVGVVGAGIFGSQLCHAVAATPGMETVLIADLDTEKAVTTFRRTGVPAGGTTLVGSGSEANAAVAAGERAVAADGTVAADADVDVLVEATGDPNVAARTCFQALVDGTHVVNATVEADTVCGPLLASVAGRNGVTYSLASGDQPGQILDLCEWAVASGFEVVAAGEATRDLEHHGTPEDALERHGHISSFGDGIDPDPRMYNTFIDGTKASVELVAAANAFGLRVDEGGTHAPSIAVEDVPETFRPASEGGILSRTGVVDSVTPEGEKFSVFVVTRTESDQLADYYGERPNVTASEDGHYHVFYRPHHFAPETTVSVATAALRNEATGTPRAQTADVVGAAKRDLEPGEKIDEPGGYEIYGAALDARDAAEANCVPLELLRGAEVVGEVGQDEFLTDADVHLDTDRFLYHLREVQDGL